MATKWRDSLKKFKLNWFEEQKPKNRYGVSDDFLKKMAVGDPFRFIRSMGHLFQFSKVFNLVTLYIKWYFDAFYMIFISIKTKISTFYIDFIEYLCIMKIVIKHKKNNLCKLHPLSFVWRWLHKTIKSILALAKERVTKKMTRSSNTEEASTSTKKNNLKWYQKPLMSGILGIGIALVVVSITYSSSVILIGMHSLLPRLMLIPQIFFAVVIFIGAFIKLFLK